MCLLNIYVLEWEANTDAYKGRQGNPECQFRLTLQVPSLPSTPRPLFPKRPPALSCSLQTSPTSHTSMHGTGEQIGSSGSLGLQGRNQISHIANSAFVLPTPSFRSLFIESICFFINTCKFPTSCHSQRELSKW